MLPLRFATFASVTEPRRKSAPGAEDRGPRVALGSDHEGLALKEKLIAHLREDRHSVKDCGGHNTEPGGAPAVTAAVAQAILAGDADVGVVVSGSGAVASMVANKLPGIRACCCQDAVSARHARRAAAADVLCLGARVLGDELAADIARAFVDEAPSDGERHVSLRRRIEQLEDDFESKLSELRRNAPASD